MLAEALDGFQALHGRRVPGTKGNLDHVVVASAGVFVVDAKRYQGRIEIRNRGWFFRPDDRLYVGRRDCSDLADGAGRFPRRAAQPFAVASRSSVDRIAAAASSRVAISSSICASDAPMSIAL